MKDLVSKTNATGEANDTSEVLIVCGECEEETGGHQCQRNEGWLKFGNISYASPVVPVKSHATMISQAANTHYRKTNVCSCSLLSTSSSSTTTKVNFRRLKSSLMIFGLGQRQF